jgi:hypothetical protein
MLIVEEIPFEMMNGNCQGYAKGRQIAPVAQMPANTTFHELAHIELGHTSGCGDHSGGHLVQD